MFGELVDVVVKPGGGVNSGLGNMVGGVVAAGVGLNSEIGITEGLRSRRQVGRYQVQVV